MQTLKERKSLLIKILAVVLLVLLCCALPQALLFWNLCLEQDFFLRYSAQHKKCLSRPVKQSPTVVGVPGGEVVFVHEGLTDKMYLLDLRTGEKRDVPNDPLFI